MFAQCYAAATGFMVGASATVLKAGKVRSVTSKPQTVWTRDALDMGSAWKASVLVNRAGPATSVKTVSHR